MMKKLLIAGLLCASLALAQGKSGKGGGGNGMGTPSTGGPPTKFDQISAILNLSKDQKKTVKTILDDGAREAAPLREQISKSRMVVGEAIGANKSEDELKQVAKSSSDLTAQLTDIEIQTFAKV